jgi:hypothetical protein
MLMAIIRKKAHFVRREIGEDSCRSEAYESLFKVHPTAGHISSSVIVIDAFLSWLRCTYLGIHLTSKEFLPGGTNAV